MSNFVSDLTQASEGKTLEFKRDLSSARPLLKTLVAFANSAGGKLVIGVTDDKQVIGVDHPLDEEERLANLIADSISPRLVPNIEMVTIEDKTLLIVEVFLSGQRPHFLKAEGAKNGVYVRLGSTNRQADRELIDELNRSAAGIAYDELPMPELSVDDLDLSVLEALLPESRPLNEQALRSLRLLVPHQGRLVPSKGAVLLVGKERAGYFPDAWIQCGRFIGTEKIDIFDHIEIDAPLPTAVDEVMLFLKKHAMRGADLSEVRRKDIWSIPLGILREAVINAIVHADYSQRGAPIRITFLDDRIEIENPGILLPGLTIEEVKEGTSRIRNNVIARLFREMNFIEQWGTGIRRIFRDAKDLGLPEPLIEEVAMRFRFTVPLAQKHDVEQADKKTHAKAQSGAQSGAQSYLILKALIENSLSASEIASILGLESKTGAFKRTINALKEEALIEYTIPEKPSSRLQKYRLTEKGKAQLFEATTTKDQGKE